MATISAAKRKGQTPNLFETRDLIRLVKDRPCLWDRFDQDYRERAVKEKAWLEIYKTIEPDYNLFSEDMKNLIGSQIVKKWYNVRDSYVKSVRHCHRVRPYIYSKLLGFLDAVYFEDKDKGFENESGDQWANESQVFVVDEADTANEAKRQKVDYEDKSDNEDSVITVLTNLLNKEDDDDRAFFKSITPAVKKLSEDSRMEFRIEVMNLLKILKRRENNTVELKKEVTDDGIDEVDSE